MWQLQLSALPERGPRTRSRRSSSSATSTTAVTSRRRAVEEARSSGRQSSRQRVVARVLWAQGPDLRPHVGVAARDLRECLWIQMRITLDHRSIPWCGDDHRQAPRQLLHQAQTSAASRARLGTSRSRRWRRRPTKMIGRLEPRPGREVSAERSRSTSRPTSTSTRSGDEFHRPRSTTTGCPNSPDQLGHRHRGF